MAPLDRIRQRRWPPVGAHRPQQARLGHHRTAVHWPADAAKQMTKGALVAAGFQAHESLWDQTAFIDLEDSFEQYFAARPKKMAGQLPPRAESPRRAGQDRLRALSPVRRERRRCRSALDLYDACEKVARRSWQAHRKPAPRSRTRRSGRSSMICTPLRRAAARWI